MTSSRALSVASSTAKFETKTIERREVGPHDVRIQIAYSGICHSDIHQVRNEWFDGIFPMVPGHEIAGYVIEVGADVKKFSIGERVGVGTFVDSCRECEYCLAGDENFCLKGNVQTYNGRFYDGTPTLGGYSSEIVVDENYTLKIPDGLELDEAAPLLCAGVTVYSPLVHWKVGPGKKVAIIGMGGLGHIAVKLAVAMGAYVTVLGRTMDKRADALEFGAHDYRATTEAGTLEDLKNSFDLVLNASSANLPVDSILAMLRVGGSLVNVGLPGKPESFDPFSLITGLKSIAGSNTGSIRATQEMLEFCAKHSIGATIEVINASQVDEAYDRVVASDVRYRFVIDASTI